MLTTGTMEELETNARLGVFFRVGLDEITTGEDPLRLWMGINEIPARIPNIDAPGATYLGAGRLLNVPELEVLINGIFERLDFYVDGVSVEHSNMLEVGAPPVVGAPVYIGIAPLTDRYQMIGDIIPIWRGHADYWGVQEEPGDPAMPRTRRIFLSVGAGDTGRSRPRRVAYTDSQQKLLYPTDDFCNRVSRYTREYVVSWPRF